MFNALWVHPRFSLQVKRSKTTAQPSLLNRTVPIAQASIYYLLPVEPGLEYRRRQVYYPSSTALFRFSSITSQVQQYQLYLHHPDDQPIFI